MIPMGTRTATVAVLLLGTAATTMPSQAEVTVSSAATKNMTCANGLCAPTAKGAVLNAGDLETLLASGNVEVTTTGSGVQADDIRIDAPLGWSATSTLALDAYESIWVGKPVAVSGEGGLAVTTNDGGSGGTFSFAPKGNVTFANPSSALAIDGTSYTLVTTLPALASAIAANPSGAYALANSYDAEQDSTYTAAPVATTFMGAFEGLGNTISHLKIAGAAPAMNLGLFAEVETSGTIAALRLTHMNIKAKRQSNVGAIAALSYGTVSNVFASGKIRAAAGRNGGATIGGGIATNVGALHDVGTSVSVKIGSSVSGTTADVGGLVGANLGTVDGSYASASINVTGPAEGGKRWFDPTLRRAA
jgi:hypothetical protein